LGDSSVHFKGGFFMAFQRGAAINVELKMKEKTHQMGIKPVIFKWDFSIFTAHFSFPTLWFGV
jgi:glycerol uptake facilitator-like aquaporin